MEAELIILPANEPQLLLVEEPPVNYYSKFYGSIKSDLSEKELDQKLKSLREEWNRDIS
jgi:hypothetical protein